MAIVVAEGRWSAPAHSEGGGDDDPLWGPWVGVSEADREYAFECAAALSARPAGEGAEPGVVVDDPVVEDDPVVVDDPVAAADSGGLPVVLAGSLRAAGLPEHVVHGVCALAPALTGGGGPEEAQAGTARAGDAALVAAADALVVVQRWCDAALTGVLRDLATAAGEELLARAGASSPEELSRTRRDRWRAQTKSVLANELQLLAGWGIQDCHDRVGFALAPRAVTERAEAALAVGDADWRQAKAWWQACRSMAVEVAGEVAARVMRAGVPSGEPAGEGTRRSFQQLKRELAREVARVQGEDPSAARRQRRELVAGRDAYAEVEDCGVGTFTLTGSTSQVVGAIDRVDRLARRARAAGDERTLAQLRADVAAALLIYGTVTLPDTGRPPGDPKPGDPRPGAPKPGGLEPGVPKDVDSSRDPRGVDATTGDPPPGPPRSNEVGGAELTEVGDHLTRVLAGEPGVNLEVIVPWQVLLDPGSRGVGEISGHGFITAEHARELALRAGVMHRLVTDPLDGRLVERSIRGYRPDRRMAEQVAAADRHCRAPGCLVPAGRCERDHEQPFEMGGAGGPTSEANLSLKHGRHHQLKTWQVWSTSMDETRNVTWETLFGRCYTTRAHDYRQYDDSRPHHRHGGRRPEGGDSSGALRAPGALGAPAGAGVPPPTRMADLGLAHVAADPDWRDRVVYAALSHRDRGDWLAGEDDHPDNELALEAAAATLHPGVPIRLRHRLPGGFRRNGPPPGQLSPELTLQDRDGTGTQQPSESHEGEHTDPGDEPPPF